ncbi:hypothetical protein NEHOM01_0755 [Nematocida homosporus]|uniref:uncharacterized protein n=1 Tax=Nematocida homosporus TaxID=1912981 RepID=UPI0022202E39|nr:uncharacterized protein NEHOM01_0755 [Nematocida homosporus]KAI5185297.1 hypothetical protein NEHOM01_0755 [Nematocida homosporus]
MSELPYYCHVCEIIVRIGDQIECPQCKQSFLEVYSPDDELEAPPRAQPFMQAIYNFFDSRSRRSRQRSIASDRRNYAIGPEINDIITRFMEEKQIKENPATDQQRTHLQKAEPPNNEACMICLNDFQPQEKGIQFPCEHIFHQPCTEAWLKLQAECPICRESL